MGVRGVLFLPGLLCLVSCSTSSPPEPLLLGHVAAFSGPERVQGEHQRRGIRLVLESMHEEPIAERRIAMLHADSRGRPDQALNEAVRLSSVNRVLALLGGDSIPSIASALQPHSLSLLTTRSHTMPTPATGVFSLEVAPAFRGEVLARHAREHLPVERTVLLMDEDHAHARATALAFERQWREKRKGTLKIHGYLGAGKDTLPDNVPAWVQEATLIVFAGRTQAFSSLQAHLRKVGRSVPLLFAGETQEWAALLQAGEVGPQVYAAVLYAEKALTATGKTLAETYRKRYEEAPDLFAWQGMELTLIAAEALRETRGTGGSRLRSELEKDRTFEGLTGTLRFQQGCAVRSLHVVGANGAPEPREYPPPTS